MGAKVWFAAAGMPFIILLPSLLERAFGATRAEQVGAMGWLLILLAPIAIGLVLRHIEEPDAHPAAAPSTPAPLLQQFAAMLRNRQFVTILILYALVGIGDAS